MGYNHYKWDITIIIINGIYIYITIINPIIMVGGDWNMTGLFSITHLYVTQDSPINAKYIYTCDWWFGT